MSNNNDKVAAAGSVSRRDFLVSGGAGVAAASVTETARAPRGGFATAPFFFFLAADGCPAKLFQSPQPGHWPSHLPDSWPHEVQKKTVSAMNPFSSGRFRRARGCT